MSYRWRRLPDYISVTTTHGMFLWLHSFVEASNVKHLYTYNVSAFLYQESLTSNFFFFFFSFWSFVSKEAHPTIIQLFKIIHTFCRMRNARFCLEIAFLPFLELLLSQLNRTLQAVVHCIYCLNDIFLNWSSTNKVMKCLPDPSSCLFFAILLLKIVCVHEIVQVNPLVKILIWNAIFWIFV